MNTTRVLVLCCCFCLAVVLPCGQLFGQEELIWDDSEQDDPFAEPEWDVPYVTTPNEIVDKMLDMAGVTGSDTLYDLGCGDGRFVITAATRLGAKGVGIDIDPELIKKCHANAAAAGVEDRVEFLNQDIFDSDFSSASVVTLYLLETVNLRLRPKLFSDLKPGTRVVSHIFSMGTWKPDKAVEVTVDNQTHKMFLWIIPANASGRWHTDLPPQLAMNPLTLDLEQKFQEIEGQAETKEAAVPLRDLRVRGDRISFTLTTDQNRTCAFQGEVSGNRIVGRVTVRSPDKEQTFDWKAERDAGTMRPLDPGNQEELEAAGGTFKPIPLEP